MVNTMTIVDYALVALCIIISAGCYMLLRRY